MDDIPPQPTNGSGVVVRRKPGAVELRIPTVGMDARFFPAMLGWLGSGGVGAIGAWYFGETLNFLEAGAPLAAARAAAVAFPFLLGCVLGGLRTYITFFGFPERIVLTEDRFLRFPPAGMSEWIPARNPKPELDWPRDETTVVGIDAKYHGATLRLRRGEEWARFGEALTPQERLWLQDILANWCCDGPELEES